jgi:PAS domain S-box-containing protein
LPGFTSVAGCYSEMQKEVFELLDRVGRSEPGAIEEALRQSVERYRLLVEQVKEYAIFSTDTQGRPTTWNEGVQRVLGFSDTEFIGAEIIPIIFTPEDLAAGVPQKELATAASTGTASNDRWLRRKDGRRFWAEGMTTGLHDEAGNLIGFSKVLRDMTERKQIENALAESEQRYRTLFDTIDEGFCVVELILDEEGNALDYRFLEVNAAFEAQTGFKDPVGRTIREISPQHELHWFEHYGRAALAGEPVRFHNYAKPLGRWFDVYAFRLGPPESRKLGLLFTDITGRKRAEEALRESEKHQRRLASHALLRAEVAAALGGRRLTIQQVLQLCAESIMRHLPAAFARIWTLHHEDQVLELKASAGMYTHIDGPHARVPVGKLKIGLIAQEARPHLTNDVLHDPRISSPEWAREQGMIAFAGYPLLTDGRVLGVTALFAKEPLFDDTLGALSSIADLVAQGIQRKRAEEELADELAGMTILHEAATRFVSPAGFQALLQNIVDAAIALTHADKGNLQLYNPETGELGIITQGGFSESWLEFFDRVDKDQSAVCAQAMAHNKRVIVEDIAASPLFIGTSALQVQLSEGIRAVQSTPILSRSGELLGMLSTHFDRPHRPNERELQHVDLLARQAADFLEQHRARQALAKAHAELESHARQLEQHVEERTASLNESLKALETLLYTIAHDLRAPNRAMQGYAHLLTTAHAGQLDEQGRFFLQRISEAAVKNEALIRDLLEFGRLMHSDFPCGPVDPSEAIAGVLRQFELEIQGRRATIDVARPLPRVWANQSALNHVFANLITNALKFAAPGTAPNIRIYPEEPPPTANSPMVRLCVRDSGIGIPLEQQEKIFEPFQRASNASHEGTGMGLAIVRKAAERMGGRAGVESQPGEGSTFWIELKKA